MRMKSLVSLVLALLTIAACLTGCGKQSTQHPSKKPTGSAVSQSDLSTEPILSNPYSAEIMLEGCAEPVSYTDVKSPLGYTMSFDSNYLTYTHLSDCDVIHPIGTTSEDAENYMKLYRYSADPQRAADEILEGLWSEADTVFGMSADYIGYFVSSDVDQTDGHPIVFRDYSFGEARLESYLPDNNAVSDVLTGTLPDTCTRYDIYRSATDGESIVIKTCVISEAMEGYGARFFFMRNSFSADEQ